MPAPRPRGTRQALAGREFAIGRVARPGLLAVAWRWRYEVLLAVLGSVVADLLAAVAGGIGAVVIMAVIGVLVSLVSPLRAEMVAFAWWLVTPHRVRTGMAQAWIHTRDGKIPVVLRTTRQTFGERVHVWCRAGTSAEDFAWGQHLIAAACWARDVRVFRSGRYAHVVVLDVIRRGEHHHGESEHGLWPGADSAEPIWQADGKAWPWPLDDPGSEGQVDPTG
jgi:hypothetical protein